MLIDQEIPEAEGGMDNSPREESRKQSPVSDRVDSLYSYGRAVLSSNYQFLTTYFKNDSLNKLSSAVCIRHSNLLLQTKTAVKRVMEEAATKKFIYFNNSTVTGLCVAIEQCLLDGLQRRTISLFEESHSMGLLKKIAKDCEPASFIVNKTGHFSDHSTGIVNGRFCQENESARKAPNSMSLPNTISGLFNKPKPSTLKYLWIKLAVVEKKLVPIIEHIMHRHQHYYEDNSIMSSCLSSSLFLELIAGPCALDFSLVKPSEHIYNDPDASELLDRHLIHSVNSWPTVAGKNIYRSKLNATRSLKNRPKLKIQHHVSPLQMQETMYSKDMASFFNMNASLNDASTNGNSVVAKEYVESLHQNMKHVLLYGKNSVLVQPKGDFGEMQGYLSLHLVAGDRLRLNWTPNQLMSNQIPQDEDRNLDDSSFNDSSRQVYRHSHDSPQILHSKLQWDSALSIKMENIVYLHCHNHEDRGGTVTFVCQDGVQNPPFHFPPGGHLLQFLICLENGLFPAGRLEPPLQQINEEKTFPRRYRRHSHDSSVPSDNSEPAKPQRSLAHSFLNTLNRSIRRRKEVVVEEELPCFVEDDDCLSCTNCDYVFKIVYPSKARAATPSREQSYEEPTSANDPAKDDNGKFTWTSKESSKDSNEISSIDTLCSIMRQQILSRAFYGWLQYYRNIKTIKTQFNNLVQPGSVQSDVPNDASEGLTVHIWTQYKETMELTEDEIYRLIYFGGCTESIRREVWPRILGHYHWSDFDTSNIDARTEIDYERSLSQWKALEVIVKQREHESTSGIFETIVDNSPTKLAMVNLTQDHDIDYQADVNSIVNMAACDLSPSKGFLSSDTSVDTSHVSLDRDIAFKEEDLACMADNMHRIDKDVDRCDRNHPYFSSHGVNQLRGKGNLRKLRNIMITWVWEHVDLGYVQGMCDLLAPLLVVLDNESLTHACFTRLMHTMIYNFPQIGTRMDENLSMMALLLQIIDRDLYDHMCLDGEVTSLYVSYRWFLLDFKRELCYADVFCVWETIWSARHVASDHFNLFMALSLLQYYRDIVLDNSMEYTDIIKFYNEMAEKHQVQKLLYIARGLIESIRDIVQSP